MRRRKSGMESSDKSSAEVTLVIDLARPVILDELGIEIELKRVISKRRVRDFGCVRHARHDHKSEREGERPNVSKI